VSRAGNLSGYPAADDEAEECRQDEISANDVAPIAVPSRPKIKAAESAASAPTQIAPQLMLHATHVSGREYRSSSRIMLSSAQNSAVLAQR
jgi:hypothetical protein